MRSSRLDLLDGATLGLAIWAAEALALGLGALAIGGAGVLGSLVDDLALWGLGYGLVGAALGVLLRTPAGRWGPVAGWALLWALGDTGVAPGALHAGLIALGALGWAIWTRLPEGRAWTAPVGTVVLGVAVIWPVGASRARGTRSGLPDVALVVIDTLRADHVGAYGYGRPTTPVLDGLAAQGLRFTAARSTSSWTLPAHASLFTGRLPAEHGAHEGNPRLDGDLQTLAERFAGSGYRTVGLSANGWVSAGTGLDRGFQEFVFLGDEGLVSQLMLPLLLARPADLGGRALTDRALAELAAARAAGEPLFLFVNLLEAHEPLGTVPEPSAFGPVDPDAGRRWMRDMPRFWCACVEGAASGDLACTDGLYRASEARLRATIDAYDAGVAYADARVGELAAAFGPDAWVAVTSDHGEHLEPDGRLGHMVWLDAALVDVPLIVRGPGVPAGAVDSGPFGLDELGGWLFARATGAPAPERRLRTVSEVHPHPASTVRAWGALYGGDFHPAGTPRRLVRAMDREVALHGGVVTVMEGGVERAPSAEERAWVERPFAGEGSPLDASTRRALETLGYVE